MNHTPSTLNTPLNSAETNRPAANNPAANTRALGGHQDPTPGPGHAGPDTAQPPAATLLEQDRRRPVQGNLAQASNTGLAASFAAQIVTVDVGAGLPPLRVPPVPPVPQGGQRGQGGQGVGGGGCAAQEEAGGAGGMTHGVVLHQD